jgi:hypothetical protein
LFSFWEHGENGLLGTGESNGPTASAPDDRWAWNINEGIYINRKEKYSDRNLLRYHFVHHKTNIDHPGTEPALPQ